jgi:hypothetical protein
MFLLLWVYSGVKVYYTERVAVGIEAEILFLIFLQKKIVAYSPVVAPAVGGAGSCPNKL